MISINPLPNLFKIIKTRSVTNTLHVVLKHIVYKN